MLAVQPVTKPVLTAKTLLEGDNDRMWLETPIP